MYACMYVPFLPGFYFLLPKLLFGKAKGGVPVYLGDDGIAGKGPGMGYGRGNFR